MKYDISAGLNHLIILVSTKLNFILDGNLCWPCRCKKPICMMRFILSSVIRLCSSFLLFFLYNQIIVYYREKYLQLSDNGRGELLGCAGTTNINSSGLTSVDSIIDSRGNSVGMFIQVQVSQHHDGREEHGSGVSTVLVLDIKSNMATTLFNTCQ